MIKIIVFNVVVVVVVVVVVAVVAVVAVVGFSGFFSLYCSHTVLYFNIIIFVERMFGYWKMLMMYMPNVRALTAESFPSIFSCGHPTL